jgi:phytoene desaturase
MVNKQVVIIGSGVAGLAAAVRLSASGLKVKVLEANSYPGGKLTSKTLNGFRFDMGPSVLTLPNLIEELSELNSETSEKIKFEYQSEEIVCRYFYEDGTRLIAFSDKEKFANELAEKLNEEKDAVYKQLEFSAKAFRLTSKLFMEQSLHVLSNFLNVSTLKAVTNVGKLKLNSSMNAENSRRFRNPKTVQLFNRFATYNGSNPYQAPALLNIIAHLEHNIGAFAAKNGMHSITRHLFELGSKLGVEYHFDTPVTKIVTDGDKVTSVIANEKEIKPDIIISDIDIKNLYTNLLDKKYYREKILNQEKSLSSLIFYWGINKEFDELGLHNILFSNNGEEEFKTMFEEKQPYHDATVYINITSKISKLDAPTGCENWFVMVNVPHNASQLPINYVSAMRKNIIEKINRVLKTNIEQHIITEDKQDAFEIEQRTGSVGGSLYGNASNNKYAAFLRHANFSSRIKNLYFCGGSVHPGGGIPLGLLGAKIVSEMIVKKYKVDRSE